MNVSRRTTFGICVITASLLLSSCADHWADLYSSAASFNSGRVAAVCGRYNICVWNLNTGRLSRKIKAPRWFSCLALSPDGRMLASGHDDASVILWNLETGAKIRQFTSSPHDAWAFAVAFSHDGKRLAAVGLGWPVRVWDVNTGDLAELSTSSSATHQVSFSPNDQILASGGDDGSIRLFSVGSKKLKFMLQPHNAVIHALAFSPDGRVLVSSSGNVGPDSWDAATGKHSHSRIDFWDVGTSNHMAEIPVSSSTSGLAFSPDGNVLRQQAMASCGYGMLPPTMSGECSPVADRTYTSRMTARL